MDSHPGLRRVSRIKGRTHVSTRPRATPLLKISLAPQGASTHVANSGAGRRIGCVDPVSHFVNLWETETDCEQSVLLTHRPAAGKAEALAQPQHGFEALDRAPGRVEGLQAAHPRHGPLDPEVVALDPLLQVLGHVMDWHTRQEPVFPGRSGL